jgi:hypothetical protein
LVTGAGLALIRTARRNSPRVTARSAEQTLLDRPLAAGRGPAANPHTRCGQHGPNRDCREEVGYARRVCREQRDRADTHAFVLGFRCSSDCEDRFCSLSVLGCGVAAVSVTLRLTGLVPSLDLSVHGCRPRPERSSWPDQELDRRALTALVVSHHSPAESPPGPEPRSVPGKERTYDQSD